MTASEPISATLNGKAKALCCAVVAGEKDRETVQRELIGLVHQVPKLEGLIMRRGRSRFRTSIVHAEELQTFVVERLERHILSGYFDIDRHASTQETFCGWVRNTATVIAQRKKVTKEMRVLDRTQVVGIADDNDDDHGNFVAAHLDPGYKLDPGGSAVPQDENMVAAVEEAIGVATDLGVSLRKSGTERANELNAAAVCVAFGLPVVLLTARERRALRALIEQRGHNYGVAGLFEASKIPGIRHDVLAGVVAKVLGSWDVDAMTDVISSTYAHTMVASISAGRINPEKKLMVAHARTASSEFESGDPQVDRTLVTAWQSRASDMEFTGKRGGVTRLKTDREIAVSEDAFADALHDMADVLGCHPERVERILESTWDSTVKSYVVARAESDQLTMQLPRIA